MLDLTQKLIPALNQQQLPGLTFPADTDFQMPDYAGCSILNLPATICALLGVPEIGNAGELIPEIGTSLKALGGSAPFERVILILMDALALHRFQRWIEDGSAPQWTHLLADGILAPLTSVVPSTTATALTTLWTGLSPAEHAIAGYEMWLKEYGMIANMIRHNPAAFQGDAGSLSKAGFDPLTFLPPQAQQATLGTHLAAHGVSTHAFQHASIANSGLSQMLFQDVSVQPFSTASEMWINVHALYEAKARQRMFTWVYWGEVDHFSHLYGPDDIRPAAEFSAFSTALQKLFIDRLSPAAREKTLLLLTADHGALHTPQAANLDLKNHPAFVQMLHMLPSGESRLPYLFARSGYAQNIAEYIQQAWPDQFELHKPGNLLQAGLFGPGQPHPRLLERLGDWVAIPNGAAYWWWADKKNVLLGRHGGLASQEMRVPLAAVCLG